MQAMYRAFLDHPNGEKMCAYLRFLYIFLYLFRPIYSVVCVAGAGRGPLVARCFKALERANREATIIAVEKNPNAFVT